MSVQAQLDDFEARIAKMTLSPGDTGYLISTEFVRRFRAGAAKDEAPSPIHNAGLQRKKVLKPGLVRDKDYIVVTKDVWDYVQGLFHGGPIITAPILSTGEPELYPARINLRTDRGPRNLTVSLAMSMLEFRELIRDTVKAPAGVSLRLESQNDPSTVYGTSGTVETELRGNAWITVRADIPVDEPLPKSKPKPEPMGRGKKGKKGKRAATRKEETRSSNWDVVSRPCGLHNYGNTCYMNASLQSLMCLPSFMKSLDDLVAKCTKGDEVCSEFARFVKCGDPRIVKKVVGERIPMFKGKDQQDAHEFVTFFLDMMHDESSDVMDALFYGKLESVTRCMHCSECVRRVESFSSLSVPVSSALRVTFVPFKMDEKLKKMVELPEDLPCVNIGMTSHSYEVITQDSYKYQEVWSLELPKDQEMEDCMFSLLFIVAKKKEVAGPMLIKRQPNDEATLEDAVWDRIQELWKTDSTITLKVKTDGPNELEKGVQGVRFSKQRVLACVKESDVTRASGFKNRESAVVVEDLQLSDLINAFFKNSQLDSRNKWKCEKCGEKSCAHQEFGLVSVPENLIIHLKRFHIGEETTRDDTPVEIPRELCLSTTEEKEINFELMAVTNHSGAADWGHYTAIGNRDGEWYNFNDSHVSHCNRPREKSEDAYLVFYSRQHRKLEGDGCEE